MEPKRRKTQALETKDDITPATPVTSIDLSSLPSAIKGLIRKFALPPSAYIVLAGSKQYDAAEFMKYCTGTPIMIYAMRQSNSPIKVEHIAYSNNMTRFINAVTYLRLTTYIPTPAEAHYRPISDVLTADMMSIAVRVDNHDLIRWLHDAKCPRSSGAFEQAALFGRSKVMRWLRINRYPWSDQVSANAVTHGSIDNLDYLQTVIEPLIIPTEPTSYLDSSECEPCPLGESAFRAAAKCGNIDMMRRLREYKCPMDAHVFTAAAAYGDLNIMKQLREWGCPWDTDTSMAAAKFGNLDNIKWLHYGGHDPGTLAADQWDGCPASEWALTSAINHGSLINVKWFHNNGFTRCEDAIPHAIDNLANLSEADKLAMVEWLIEHGYPLDFSAFDSAALNGDLKLMKLLHEKGCPHSDEVFYHAADHGNLDNLKWLYSVYNKTRVSSDTFRNAARFGSIVNMEWLYRLGIATGGCLWDARTFEAAAAREDFVMMQWLLESGCPWDGNVTIAIARCGNIKIMRWLCEHKCPWGESTFHEAIQHDNIAMLKLLHDYKCPWSEFVFTIAIYYKKLNTLKWLADHDCPYNPRYELTVIRLRTKFRITPDGVRQIG